MLGIQQKFNNPSYCSVLIHTGHHSNVLLSCLLGFFRSTGCILYFITMVGAYLFWSSFTALKHRSLWYTGSNYSCVSTKPSGVWLPFWDAASKTVHDPPLDSTFVFSLLSLDPYLINCNIFIIFKIPGLTHENPLTLSKVFYFTLSSRTYILEIWESPFLCSSYIFILRQLSQKDIKVWIPGEK